MMKTLKKIQEPPKYIETLPRPVLGSILVELIQLDEQEYLNRKLGIDKEMEARLQKTMPGFVIEHGEAIQGEERNVTGRVFKKTSLAGTPIKKGKVISMAPDAFGESFIRHYGKDAAESAKPKIGDIIYFIPGKFFEVDFERKYGLIRDEDIKAIE